MISFILLIFSELFPLKFVIINKPHKKTEYFESKNKIVMKERERERVNTLHFYRMEEAYLRT